MKRVIGYWFLSLLAAFLAACQTNPPETTTGQNSVRASVQASVTEGVAPLAVTFDAASSQGNITAFSWVFGDGTEGQGKKVNHTFTQTGVFNVRLTVADGNGNEDSKTVTVTVQNSGSNPTPNPNPNPNPGETPTPAPQAIPVSAGVVLPLRRSELEEGFGEMGVNAVYFASQQSGANALVFSGTATEDNNGTFTYNAQPTDRLRVVFKDGFRLEYFITTLQGDFTQEGGKEFLGEDHNFVYRLVTSEGTDVNVTLSQTNNVYTKTVTGNMVSGGTSYSVNMTTQGESSSFVDPPAFGAERDERITGTISSEGFSLTINERFHYKLISFDNAIETMQKDINNTWTIGNNEYTLTNARIFRIFKDAFPVEREGWRATGQLTRNSQVIGGLSFEETFASVDTVLTADGEKTVIFSDSKINP